MKPLLGSIACSKCGAIFPVPEDCYTQGGFRRASWIAGWSRSFVNPRCPACKNPVGGSPANQRRAQAIVDLREQDWTLKAIAKHYGLTPERIRQIVGRYEKQYGPICEPQSEADLLEYQEEHEAKKAVRAILRERQTFEHIRERYARISAELGHPATSTDLQRRVLKGRVLYNLIWRKYGGMKQFYHEEGITKHVHPYFLRRPGT